MTGLLMDYMTEDEARRAARPRRSNPGALASARRGSKDQHEMFERAA
jgi:hypothetical protein